MSAQPSPLALTAGLEIGNRFVLEELHSSDALGGSWISLDKKTGRRITLRFLPSQFLASSAAMNALRQSTREASSIAHPHLVPCYGVGVHTRTFVYVATGLVQGRTLLDFVRSRIDGGSPVSVPEATGIVKVLCETLQQVHRAQPHGCLRPQCVLVRDDGLVLLTDIGIAAPIYGQLGELSFGPREDVWFAPEVGRDRSPSIPADVFGIGALWVACLTGRPPGPDAPSVLESLPRNLREIALQCLQPDPAQRPSMNELMRTLGMQPLDSSSGAVPPPAASKAAAAQKLRAPSAPALAQRSLGRTEVSPGSAAQPSGALNPRLQPNRAPAQTEDDLTALLAELSANDAPRWMTIQGGVDHGPFSAQELVGLILQGKLRGEHGLFNMETRERCPVQEHGPLRPFLEHYQEVQAEAAANQAARRSVLTEKAMTLLKTLAAIAGILGIVYAVVVFTRTRKAKHEAELSNIQISELFRRGELKLTGSAGLLDSPKGARSRRSARNAPAHGVTATGHSSGYDDAMNQAVDMGDVSQNSDERQLSTNEISRVMQSRLNVISPCVGPELARSGKIGSVQVDMAIANSGQVLGVSARQGSPAFRSCVESAVRRIRFPTFGAARMGARYTFHVE